MNDTSSGMNSDGFDAAPSVMVVGVDGSESSKRAIAWCAAHAGSFGCEIVAVHAIELPPISAFGEFGAAALSATMSDAERAELHDEIARDWCKPLADAGLTFRVVLIDGNPAAVVRTVADHEKAQLVVTGRRGRGGFAELLLGSTSHQLAHHLGRPLVIVP
jgi:nucleotide-binding universal stress UspA family protein